MNLACRLVLVCVGGVCLGAVWAAVCRALGLGGVHVVLGVLGLSLLLALAAVR